MDSRPIGVFDSGLGGLTVLKEIKKRLPNENLIYLGDTARVPYGTRSKEVVIRFSLEDVQFLTKKGVKAVVIACNTASSLAAKEVEKGVEIPVFEVVGPAAKQASNKTKNKRIGVIGTRGTVGSHAYKRKIQSIDKDIKVFEKETPLFVPLIEEGETDGKLIEEVAEKYLSFFKDKDIDVLIMGCTHYPIIKPVIRKFVGKDVVLVDPGYSISIELEDSLKKEGLQNTSNKKAKSEYFITDMNGRFSSVAELFMKEKINDKVKKAVLSS